MWNLVFTGLLGVGSYIFGETLLSLYNTNPEVISLGMERLLVVNVPYFLLGIYDVFSGTLRGIGYSLLPMAIALAGICLLRIVWLATFFKTMPTMTGLMLSYPVSWLVTAIVMGGALFILFQHVKKQFSPQELSAQ